MREILFRAKRIDNGEWVYGYYWTNELHNHFIKRAKDENGQYNTETFEIDPKTLGQYTGLKDKDGNKIFEGDVVEGVNLFKEKIMSGVVKFTMENGLLVDLGAKEFFHIDHFTNVKIIGNIHDNLELLKEEQ